MIAPVPPGLPSATPRNPPAPVGGLRVRDIVRVLRGNWLLIGACVALFAAIGLFLIARQRPVYQAAASLRIEEQNLSAATLDLSRLTAASQIDTEMEMLRSRTLAEGVVDSLALRLRLVAPDGMPRGSLFAAMQVRSAAPLGDYRLEQQPGGVFLLRDRGTGMQLGLVAQGQRVTVPGASFDLTPDAYLHRTIDFAVISRDDAVDAMQGGLRVRRPNMEASIVEIRFTGADPEIVRDVPNILADRLIEERRDMRQTETRSTVRFLRGQIANLSQQLAAAEDTLRSFRQAEGVVNLQDQARSAISQSAELQAQRDVLNAERAALAQLLTNAPADGGTHPYRNLVAFPSLLRNQAVSGLLNTLASVEERRTELLTRRTPEDPEVQVLTDRIRQIEQQLRAVVTTYLQGLTNQVQALDETLARSGVQMSQIPGREIQLARLQRDAQTLQEIVTTLTTRLREAEIIEAVEDPSVRLVDAARLPARPASQRKSLILGASMIFGLLLGVAGAFLRDYTDSSVRTREDIETATGLPVLGLIPRAPVGDGQGGVRQRFLAFREQIGSRLSLPGRSGDPAGEAAAADRSAALIRGDGRMLTPLSDAYDRLHTNILFARTDREVKALLITSALPGDGKTTTAANLAITLAERGLRVLLVDADLRRGVVHHLFGTEQEPGLTEVLAERVPFQDAYRQDAVRNGGALHFLTVGHLPPNPAQLLGSPQMHALLERLKRDYDRIILDSSPLNIVADATLLGIHADGIVLVARAGTTPFEAVVYAAEQLHRANLPLLGAVLNDIDFARAGSYDAAYAWQAQGRSYYAGSGASGPSEVRA